MNWYEEYIEEPVRELVKLLRNNGINTTCSCGHEGYVECQYSTDGTIMQLHNLLFNYFHENGVKCNYTITVILKVVDGHSYPSLNIDFPDLKKPDSTDRIGH